MAEKLMKLPLNELQKIFEENAREAETEISVNLMETKKHTFGLDFDQ